MTSDGFAFRSFVQGDLPDVRRIFEAGMRLYCDPLPKTSALKRSWEAYIRHALKSDLSDIRGVYFEPGGHFWVVEDQREGKIVGCVGVERLDGETCELRRMSVAPEARKGGLGSRLCKTVEHFASTTGFERLILSTGSIMVPAIGLYHRNGFKCYEIEPAEGKFKEMLDGAGEVFYSVLFQKPLSTPEGRWMWNPTEPHQTNLLQPEQWVTPSDKMIKSCL